MTPDTPEADKTPLQTRADYLADARRQSVRDLMTPDKSGTTESTSTAETDKWRNLINASSDGHLTALWERYHTDCQVRGISHTHYCQNIGIFI